MTYPTITTSTSALYAAGSLVAYPAVAAGRILFLTTVGTYNTGESGWTIITQATSGSYYLTLYAKVATGSESGNLTLAGSCYGRAMFTVDAGSASPLPEAASSYTTGVDTPDPPSISPSWGARDYLLITYGLMTSSFASPSVPSGWTDLSKNSSGSAAVILGYKTVTMTTYDPPAFNDSDTSTSNAYTLTAAIPFIDAASNSLFFGSNF